MMDWRLLFDWAINWWPGPIAVLGMCWFARKQFRKGTREGRMNSVLFAVVGVIIGMQMIPITWVSAVSYRQSRSVVLRSDGLGPVPAEWSQTAEQFVESTDARYRDRAVAGVRMQADGSSALVLARYERNRTPNNLGKVVSSDEQLRSNTAGPAQTLLPPDASALGSSVTAMRCWEALCEWRHPGATGVIIGLSGALTTDAALAVRDTALVSDASRYNPGETALSLVLQLFGLAAVILVSLVLHEIGHAVAAYAVRFTVLGMVLGAGRTLLTTKIGSLPITIRLLPIGGHVMTQSTRPGDDHFARVAVWSAGPGINLLVAVVAGFGLAPFGGANQWILIINGLLCIANLVPYSKFIPEADRRVGTDGWQIITALRAMRTAPATDATMAPIW
jgi:hypothetical protein